MTVFSTNNDDIDTIPGLSLRSALSISKFNSFEPSLLIDMASLISRVVIVHYLKLRSINIADDYPLIFTVENMRGKLIEMDSN